MDWAQLGDARLHQLGWLPQLFALLADRWRWTLLGAQQRLLTSSPPCDLTMWPHHVALDSNNRVPRFQEEGNRSFQPSQDLGSDVSPSFYWPEQ